MLLVRRLLHLLQTSDNIEAMAFVVLVGKRDLGRHGLEACTKERAFSVLLVHYLLELLGAGKGIYFFYYSVRSCKAQG